MVERRVVGQLAQSESTYSTRLSKLDAERNNPLRTLLQKGITFKITKNTIGNIKMSGMRRLHELTKRVDRILNIWSCDDKI